MTERIVGDEPPTCAFLLNFILGMVLVGWALVQTDNWCHEWVRRVGGPSPLPLGGLSCGQLTALLFVFGEAFFEQRFRRAWCDVSLLVFGGGIVPLYYGALGRLYSPSQVAVVWAVFSVVVIGVRLGGILLVRRFICKLTIQTGTLCWYCGYDLRGSCGDVCPECGRSGKRKRGWMRLRSPCEGCGNRDESD